MCGDPPNIIIGTSLGLSFFDFLGNTGVIAGVCLVFTVVYFFLCFRKPLAESEKNRPANVVYPDAASAVKNRAGFYGCGASFLVVVVLLITHAQTELTVATIGCIAAALMSLVTLPRGCLPGWTIRRCCFSRGCSWWWPGWSVPAAWACWRTASPGSAAARPL